MYEALIASSDVLDCHPLADHKGPRKGIVTHPVGAPDGRMVGHAGFLYNRTKMESMDTPGSQRKVAGLPLSCPLTTFQSRTLRATPTGSQDEQTVRPAVLFTHPSTAVASSDSHHHARALKAAAHGAARHLERGIQAPLPGPFSLLRRSAGYAPGRALRRGSESIPGRGRVELNARVELRPSTVTLDAMPGVVSVECFASAGRPADDPTAPFGAGKKHDGRIRIRTTHPIVLDQGAVLEADSTWGCNAPILDDEEGVNATSATRPIAPVAAIRSVTDIHSIDGIIQYDLEVQLVPAFMAAEIFEHHLKV